MSTQVQLDMIAHGRAAMQKAKEIRAQQMADYTKLAEAAPAIVDSLIRNRFLTPDVRDITIKRMQKTGFAIGLLKAVAEQACPKGSNKQASSRKYALGTASQSNSHSQYSINNTYDSGRSPLADAAWESMIN